MKLLSLPEMSLYGAILIAAVLLLRAVFLNRLPKRTFSSLWGLVILRLLLPLSIASAVSLYTLLPAPEPAPALAPVPAISAPAPSVTVTPTHAPTALPSPIAEPSPLPETVSPTATVTDSTMAEPKADVSPETILTLIWCSGAALLLLVFTAVYLRGRREFRMSLPIQNDFIEAWQKSCPLRRKVTVRRSDRISAPLTYGVFCPVILLPDPIGTDEKTLGHILTHELVHIRRFDAVKKPLCALAVCLHWFNPLVWIMFFFFTRDLELACDEGAIRQLGIGDRSDYAKTLIGMEARKSGFLPFFSHFAGFAAEERIKAIMKLKKTSVITSIAAVLLVCGTAGVFLTSAAAKPEEETALTEKEKSINEMEETLKNGTSDSSEWEWWTAEEYEKWIEEQEKEMESLIGTGNGWYDKQGEFHTFTRESMNEILALYRATLEEIKRGVLVSKPSDDGVVLMQSLPKDEEQALNQDELEKALP
ncbi:MAG: M56 family metallopeptidase, partial [Ruminiclostridium sp.]|nr:M56 family metallopeptidase [Ruminiclostridium sp.]